jgi:hypothetical protein
VQTQIGGRGGMSKIDAELGFMLYALRLFVSMPREEKGLLVNLLWVLVLENSL